MKIYRKTKSPCPKCFNELDAQVITDSNGVFLIKKCSKHGKFKIKICDSEKYYNELHDLYFFLNGINKNRQSLKRYIFLYITYKCNNRCKICYNRTNSNKNSDPTLNEIYKEIKKYKNTELIPFGGEPTVRKDLDKIIAKIKKSSNIPTLFTNGLELSKFEYLKKLVKSGLSQIRFSFLGFKRSYYKEIENKDTFDAKLKALNNIEKLKIPTILECTICDKVNMENMWEIYNYAVKSNSIKSVMFRPYSFLGNKGLSKSFGTNPLMLIQELEKQSNKQITEKDFIDFQRYLFLVSDFFSMKVCFYQPYLIMWKKGKQLVPITRIIDFYKIKKNLRKYIKIRKKNNFLAKLYFIFILTLPLVKFKNLRLFFESTLITLFRKYDLSKVTDKFFLLSFPVNCGPDVYDKELTPMCTAEEMIFNQELRNLADSNLCRERRQKDERNN